jgi:Cu(I)/Ag(I) efflux system membrane fusion protein
MRISKILITAAIFAIGLGSGIVITKWTSDEPSKAPSSSTAESDKLPIYWQAPMDPNFRSDVPGKSPMGMDLIPVYADEGDSDDGQNLVRINPTVENNIGVRVGEVKSSASTHQIETVGTIQIDDDTTAFVDVRTEGWIENMPIKAVGDPVKKGQLLFRLYSRPLVSAQEEYLQALRMNRENLVAATKSRLLALGLSNYAIEELKKRGTASRLMNIRAPQNGIVTMMGAGEGAFVKPGMTVLKLVDLNTVWAIADIFEDQIGQVSIGQDVVMHMPGIPGREWSGKIDYIYPTINAKARTLQVRVKFDNPDGILRPEMYARLTIKTGATDESIESVLSIPREALIRTGKMERVILALGDGRYQPAQVVSGREIGDDIEILSGLRMGEKIVISSQFLIDSEASFRGTMLRMTAKPSGMDMEMSEGVPETEPIKASEGTTTGRVISLMREHGMITIDHDPIEALDWPAMAMPFVTDPDLLKPIKAGDHVRIIVQTVPDANGNYVLSEIKVMKMPETK